MAVCIQETHVNSDAEAEELEELWARMWNLRVDAEKPMSFWSVTSARAAGVAILLHPASAGKYTRQELVGMEGRGLMLTSHDDGIMNIYAPNHRHEREMFYEEVQAALAAAPARMLLLGDFNCVQDPSRDRVTGGRWSTGATESPQLDALVRYWRLVDGFQSVHQTPNEQPDETTLTYWHQGHGARLDRGYATPTAAKWIAGAEVRPPGAATDHHGLLFWLRDPQLMPLTAPLAPLVYPIRGRDPTAIADEVQHAVRAVVTAACRNDDPWDITASHLREELTAIKRRERKRAAKAMKKWRQRMRKRIRTLDDAIAYEKRRVEKRLELRRGARLGNVAGTSILQRISQRERHPITSLDAPAGEPASLSLADTMAATWEPLLSHCHASLGANATAASLYTIPSERRIVQEDNEWLMRPTTVDEVREIIAATGEHKAAGDDRLSNDFFRDCGDVLAPYLALVFNRVLEGGEIPDSYGAAVIVPLPKNGNSPNPMDYRPIALLQSCYKILTKLIAFRLRKSLGQLINDDQRGFVQGRQMADNIRIMQALLQQELEFEDDSAEKSPGILFIDFKKAYDSLNREFLYTALRQFGFQDAFVELVQRLHARTTARFLVNGELSRVVAVNTGIRQGCPLAPLLFLIAVETLKYAVDQTPGLRGIPLHGQTSTTVHGWSAFVDDSVVFVEAGAMLHELQVTLDAFAAVSGLQIQPAKSHLVLLNPRCQMAEFAGFPVLAAGDTVRYLGVLIGLGDLADPNWEHRLKMLKLQLGLAARLVTSVPDRVVVLNAVAIPSLLFTAKFYTPSPAVLADIEQIWKQFLWQGTITSQPLRSHKIAMSIISQSTHNLGLGVQDPKAAMVAQAARCILEWNAKEHDKAWSAMHAVICAAKECPVTTKLHTFPSARDGPARPTLTGRTDLLSLGWDVVLRQTRSRYPIPQHLVDRRAACIQALERASPCLQWMTSSTGRFCIPTALRAQWTETSLRNYTAMAPEIRSFWDTFPWANNAWVTDQHGEPLRRQAFPSFTPRLLGDVDLQYQGNGTFLFRKPVARESRPSAAKLEKIAQWVWKIIVNTGIHFADKNSSAAAFRVYNIAQHPTFDQYEWKITDNGALLGTSLAQKWNQQVEGELQDQLTAQVAGWGQPVTFSAANGSTRAAIDLKSLQNLDDGHVILAGHPRINHGPTLTRVHHRLTRPLGSSAIKRALRLTPAQERQARQQGVMLVCGRLERTRNSHGGIFGAMQSSTPRQLTTTIAGLSLYQQLFRYRLLLGALNTRVGMDQKGPCPHKCCQLHQKPVAIDHIVWECDGARSMWASVVKAWTHRPEPPTAEFVFACFRPEAPVLSAQARTALAEIDMNWATVHQASTMAWNVLCTITTQQLWLIRNDAIFRGTYFAVPAIVSRIWKTIEGQLSSLVHQLLQSKESEDVGRCLKTIHASITADYNITAPEPREVRLYYDGGARGNPGRSGAGSVILERDAEGQWAIVWWQATYCGSSQTNNYAEHVGAATGLEECERRYAAASSAIRVIGDSTLVTQQLRGRAKVSTTKLLRPWTRSKHAMATLYSYECLHTRRAGNKMADHLANIAMDKGITETWDARSDDAHPVTTQLETLIHNDIATELNNLQPVPILETHLRTINELHQHQPAQPAQPAEVASQATTKRARKE